MTTSPTPTQTYVVQQTVEVNVSYLVEAVDPDDALDVELDPARVIEVYPVDWPRPWTADLVDGPTPAVMTAKQLAPYAVLGLVHPDVDETVRVILGQSDEDENADADEEQAE
jgi:hypothetical protein